jgi:hypothetical protein
LVSNYQNLLSLFPYLQNHSLFLCYNHIALPHIIISFTYLPVFYLLTSLPSSCPSHILFNIQSLISFN